MEEAVDFAKAKEKAFRLLGIRAHSERELRLKLKSGNFAPAVVEDVIVRCRELGYINDGEFARQRARALATNRLAGNRRIAFDLQEKGVAADLRAAAIAAVDEEMDEAERIRRLLGKRLPGQTSGRTEEKEKARLIRNLMGKGFPLELILRTINEQEEEAVHDDDGQ
ncbi:MAG: regulatory protein RecX [Syntrophales bacterium]